MSTTQITKKIEDLLELEQIMEEAKAEADTLRDEIKQEMINRNTDVLTVGRYIVRWTSVLSQRFDANAFKKVMPDISRLISNRCPAGDSRLPDRIQERRRMLCLN